MNKPDSKSFIIKKTGLSVDAKKVWDSLSKSQQEAIHRNNPFRCDRNEIIRDLKKRKIKVRILTEISGLSWTQILRITKRDNKKPDDKLSLVKQWLSEIRDKIDKTAREIDDV